ncbi:hypothetical protein [Sphingomonas immobilis]|uniref:DUF2550 family protein n=1 Tax=Sphingomonas immobilis TaxID=3063997 RepID=A0ABT9A0J8_9SPHN|nr:hypothetical protein [Sphingomonas sp. CA1-15]MDO7843360.1 hypothetical protein [Sphingomonas sp. CA1-15]
MSTPVLINAVVGVAILVTILTMLVLRARSAAQRSRERGFAMGGDAAATDIPVRGTYWHSAVLFGGRSRNSLNPSFAVLPEGFRIRVIGTTHVRFEEISQIDARKMWGGGMALAFHVEGQIFVARFGDAALAKQVLSQMARTIPLTADAAMLRDGSPAAATPGLRPYKGPYR